MGKTLVVAEKPSVGRDIARVLKCRDRGEGYLAGEQYVISWAIGHLVSLCEPDEIDDKYKKWRMEDLPILPSTIPLKVLPKTRKQFTVLKKWMGDKEIDSIICATDAGREGELIFRFIYEKAQCKKPVERLWISSMTDEAILQGFASLAAGTSYDKLYSSALCRAKADWMVGMNASRAYTLQYGNLLSIGRVQTPTLAILVRRQQEINAFVPEKYFTVTADFGDYQGLWFKEGEKNDTRIQSAETARAIASEVKGKEGTVVKWESVPKQELPPQLYDLTSLQRDANRMLGFTAKKTLQVAQSLYETHKAITYPRTDSRYLPDDMLPSVYKAMQQLPSAYQPHLAGAMPDGKLKYTKRIFDKTKVSDHHAILPTTKKTDIEKLPPDEKRLFDLVAKRLLAAFHPVHTYDALQIVTAVGEHNFRTTGRAVTQMGWKAVYARKDEGETATKRKKKETAEEKPLPPFAMGDRRLVADALAKEESTKAPPLYTDGSLLSAMEHAGREIEDDALREQMKGSGLGTPATRAAIIERLLTVGYASRSGKAIAPTEKGMALIGVVPNEIASPETTGKWELGLHHIAEGRQDPVAFMDSIARFSSFLVDKAKEAPPAENPFPKEERKPGRDKKTSSKVKPIEGLQCPLCKTGKVTENTKAFSCSRWKEGCHFTLWKDGLKKGGGPQLTERLIKLLLETGEVKGSSGTLSMVGDTVHFTKGGEAAPSIMLPISYVKK